MYDASDLGRLLFGCPSIDGLLDVIADGDLPESQRESDEQIRQWQAFVSLAHGIKARRRQACGS